MTRKLINTKLPLFGDDIKGRLSTGYATNPSNVISTLETYVERSPFYYGYSLTLLLFQFLDKVDVIPKKYRKPITNVEIGQWLTFAKK